MSKNRKRKDEQISEDIVINDNKTFATSFDEGENKKTILEVILEDKKEKEVKVKQENYSKYVKLRDKKLKRLKKKNSEEELIHYDKEVSVGLTNEEAKDQTLKGLVNYTYKKGSRSAFQIIFRNVFSFFNCLYLIITIAFILIGMEFAKFIYLATVIPNLLFSIFFEIKSKIAVEKLSLVDVPCAHVIRDSCEMSIPVEHVVIDDVIVFKAGDQICVDAKLLTGTCEVNEALLTGESDNIIKQEKNDNLYSGSFITSGVAYAKVVEVGHNTYIEKLSDKVKKYTKQRSELLNTLRKIIKTIAVLIIIILFLTIMTQYGYAQLFNDIKSGAFQDIEPGVHSLEFIALQKLVKSSGAQTVAMIPAGLFLMTTIALSLSQIKLASQNALVQDVYAIEMLARVDTLCLDKTGTITTGEMRIVGCDEVNNDTAYSIKEIIGSMMNSFEDTNLTSEALANYFDLNDILKPTKIIPFSSKRKFSAVEFEKEGWFVIGAADFILTKQMQEKYSKMITYYTEKGCRVIILGSTKQNVNMDTTPIVNKVLAIIAIKDQIRNDAKRIIKYFQNNQVEVKVISGDDPLTVSKIAQFVEIDRAERYINLYGLSDGEVEDAALEYTVFGRVSPEQKRIIIRTLKSKGRTVAMTGDGVNDILALKEADCSIAMSSGSPATCKIASLVLKGSKTIDPKTKEETHHAPDFASLNSIVNEGRRVINNIQKISMLFLVKTGFSIILSIMYIIFSTLSGPLRTIYPFDTNDLTIIEVLVIGIAGFLLTIQPNTNKVKGKFLKNVMKNAIPGVATVVLLHLVITLLKLSAALSFLLEEDIHRSILVVLTTEVMFIVLYYACKEFRPWKVAMYTCVLAFGIIAVLFAFQNGKFLGVVTLSRLDSTATLLLLVFGLMATTLMSVFQTIVNKLSHSLKKELINK